MTYMHFEHCLAMCQIRRNCKNQTKGQFFFPQLYLGWWKKIEIQVVDLILTPNYKWMNI